MDDRQALSIGVFCKFFPTLIKFCASIECLYSYKILYSAFQRKRKFLQGYKPRSARVIFILTYSNCRATNLAC